MTNALTKVSGYAYVPGTPGVPATPGTPGVPAYTSYSTVEVCTFRVISGMDSTGFQGIVNSPEFDGFDEFGNAIQTNTVYGYYCAPEVVATRHPAVPPTPPTPGIPASPSFTYDVFDLGWNAGARSIAWLEGSGYFTFTAPLTAVGIVVGFNGEDSDAGYANIEHGFRFSGSTIRVYEMGVQKLSIGPWTLGQTFKIERQGSLVRYYQGSTLVYTSTLPSTGPVFIDTSFYSSGDYIDNPALVPTSGAEMSLVPITGSAAKPMEFKPLTLLAGTMPRVLMTFQPLAMMASDRPYAAVIGNLSPLRITARSEEAAPAYALCSMSFSQLTGAGLCLTGEIGQVVAALKPMVMMASDRPYGDGRATLQPLRVYSSSYEGNLNASLGGVARAFAPLTAEVLIVVVMDANFAVTSVLATQLVMNADVPSDASVSDTMAIQQVLEAAVPSFMTMDAYVPAYDGTSVNDSTGDTAWVVNWDSQASAKYENYNFTSFAKIGQYHYGVKPDGIYLLEGDDDEGSPIHASVSFGKLDFGSMFKKRVPYAYMGVSSTGQMFLKVTANNETYTYAARRADDDLRAQRVDLGRGLSATYLEFELYNSNGADFELGSVEFSFIPLTRKI